ncbi:hypothetical protein HMPREF1545_03108 [Oscillibacter sp. KLE 1728]|nr:hypothetical protein HMPREF1545_03108 [Oscillibacter sp. KLE 1728]ERK58656.1 hypothetical protein HMPREF1546_03625 [Oscillibacter sp. KLE 1745]
MYLPHRTVYILLLRRSFCQFSFSILEIFFNISFFLCLEDIRRYNQHNHLCCGSGTRTFPEHYLSFSKPPSGANYYIDEEYDPGWRACVVYRKNTYFSDACRQCVKALTKIFSDFVPSIDLEASTKKMGN